MHVSKHHGLGNDFLVVLGSLDPISGPGLARSLCDRRRGIGADGMILGAPAPHGGVDAVMHLWNADGGRAEMSGNGIRCLAQAVVRARDEVAGTVVVDTDAGRRVLEVTPTADPATVEVRVDLGPVGPGPGLPTVWPADPGAARAGTADLGNPHLVLLVEDPAAVDLAGLGPRLQSAYPEGINVEVVSPAGPDGPDASDAIVLRVWERGVGITEACGTGAAAAAHLAHRWGLVGDRVSVRMPGGAVVVDLADDHAVLTGPATHVADLDVRGPVLRGEEMARV